MPPQPAAQHQWFYLRETFTGEHDEGPFTEPELFDLAKSGKIKPKTKLKSPTRTKGQLVYAEALKGIMQAIELGKQEAAEAKEMQKQAKAEEAQARADAAKAAAAEKAAAKAAPPPVPAQPVGPFVAAQRAAVVRPTVATSAATLPSGQQPTTIIIQQVGFHPQRVLVIIAAIAGMGGIFLPWVTMPIVGSIAGTAGDGWFVLAGFLPALGVALTPDWSRPISLGRALTGAIFSGIALALVVWKFSTIAGINADAPKDGMFGAMQAIIGPGLYLNGIAAVAVIILLLAFPRNKPANPTASG